MVTGRESGGERRVSKVGGIGENVEQKQDVNKERQVEEKEGRVRVRRGRQIKNEEKVEEEGVNKEEE